MKKDFLEFIVEVPKGSLIKSYKLPVTLGALPKLKSPDSCPIYGALLEKERSKYGESHSFFPLAFYKALDHNYPELIIVGVKYENPEALNIQEELIKVEKYLRETHQIGVSGNREAVKILLSEMEYLSE